MEPDRYQQNHALYIFCMISLVISMGMFCYFIYIFPNLAFHWRYDVPTFISYLRIWIVENYGLSTSQTSWMIMLAFLSVAFVFGLFALIASRNIENSIYLQQVTIVTVDEKYKKRARGLKNTSRFFWKVLGVVLLAYLATIVFHLIISSGL